MSISRNRLYVLIIVSCIAGYSWLIINKINYLTLNKNVNVCLFKNITTLPCPSCGTTRAILSIIDRKYLEAFLWNPLGFILLPILLILPIWIVFDLFTKRKSFYVLYIKAEKTIKNKVFAYPAILIILIIWIWNIYKKL